MKHITILLILITINYSSKAQQWAWITATTTTSLSVAAPGVLGAGTNAIACGALVQKNLLWGSDVYGNYVISEYDTAGNPGSTLNLNGKAMLIDAKCDPAGNYYLLGKVFDTASFSTGFHTAHGPTEPEFFLCRLDKGTLALSWFKYLGTDDNSSASAFTVSTNGLYIVIDTSFEAAVLYKYDLVNGNSTAVLQQVNAGIVTSVQVDDQENVYIAGGGASIVDVDFNGHHISIPSTVTYPAYIVRYKAGGIYDWSKVMSDVTLQQRQLSLSNNNSIYYSGRIMNSFTLDAFSVHAPAWVYDFLVCRMDSAGNVQWLRQLPDSLNGDAQVRNAYHAVACSDGSLSVSSGARYKVNWGNGVTTDNGIQDAATVVNYAANGTVNWALPVVGNYSVPGYISTDGNNIWVSGTGFDSTALRFGSFSLPSTYYSYRSFLAKVKPGVPPATSIKIPTSPLSVNIFPNPAATQLSVQYSSAMNSVISITEMGGKEVYRAYASGNTIKTINIGAYPRGLYFVEIVAGSEHFLQKIAVQ